jgi:hypothetical protein
MGLPTQLQLDDYQLLTLSFVLNSFESVYRCSLAGYLISTK